MQKLSMRELNKELKKQGLILVRGNGYFWVCGDKVQYAPHTAIFVNKIADLSFSEWLSEVANIVKESDKRVITI